MPKISHTDNNEAVMDATETTISIMTDIGKRQVVLVAIALMDGSGTLKGL